MPLADFSLGQSGANTARYYSLILPDLPTLFLPNLFFSQPKKGFRQLHAGKGLKTNVQQLGFTKRSVTPNFIYTMDSVRNSH